MSIIFVQEQIERKIRTVIRPGDTEVFQVGPIDVRLAKGRDYYI